MPSETYKSGFKSIHASANLLQRSKNASFGSLCLCCVPGFRCSFCSHCRNSFQNSLLLWVVLVNIPALKKVKAVY